VHAADGLDEISIGAETRVAELRDGQVGAYTITPEQFGLEPADLAAITVGSVQESLAMLRDALDDRPGAPRDIVALNGGAAIYAAGRSESLEAGVHAAQDALASGEARRRLEALVALSNSL